MKGLLLKDFYMLARHCRAYLLLTVIFLAVAAAGQGLMFYAVYPMLLAGVLPVSIISYDERYRWNAYCDTLPVSRKQVVSGKYIISLLLFLTVFVLSAIALLVRKTLDASFTGTDCALLLSVLCVFGLVESAILLPFVFRFGAEKGRIAYYIVLCASCAVVALFSISGVSARWSFTAGPLHILIPILAAVIFALSWRLSVSVYEKSEF